MNNAPQTNGYRYRIRPTIVAPSVTNRELGVAANLTVECKKLLPIAVRFDTERRFYLSKIVVAEYDYRLALRLFRRFVHMIDAIDNSAQRRQ